MSAVIFVFLLHGLFSDEGVRCNEYNATCTRDEYHQFLNEDINPPSIEYEYIPSWELEDAPYPNYPEEEVT